MSVNHLSYAEFKEKLKTFKRPYTLKGGLATNHKPNEFSPLSLYKGYKVELEHTGRGFHTPVAIAMDHLVEHKDYYKALDIMEKKLERKKKRSKSRY